MTSCMWSEFDFSQKPALYKKCANEATLTCCDYGGKVCSLHKCRCSRPLELDGDNPAVELGRE